MQNANESPLYSLVKEMIQSTPYHGDDLVRAERVRHGMAGLVVGTRSWGQGTAAPCLVAEHACRLPSAETRRGASPAAAPHQPPLIQG